jgi:hypothetical protein
MRTVPSELGSGLTWDTEGVMQQKASAPVAARTTDSRTNGELQDAANLHVQVDGATKKFHLWQQLPAWTLGFAAIGLGFLMVLRGYDSAGGWFAVSTAIIISVIASFRSPFAIGETSVSSAPGRRPAAKKPAASNPPTGG